MNHPVSKLQRFKLQAYYMKLVKHSYVQNQINIIRNNQCAKLEPRMPENILFNPFFPKVPNHVNRVSSINKRRRTGREMNYVIDIFQGQCAPSYTTQRINPSYSLTLIIFTDWRHMTWLLDAKIRPELSPEQPAFPQNFMREKIQSRYRTVFQRSDKRQATFPLRVQIYSRRMVVGANRQR